MTAIAASSTDPINAANGGYTITYVDRQEGGKDYTLPTFKTDFLTVEARPDDDPALTQDRTATGNYSSIHGVAVTANATTTVKEIAVTAGGSKNVAIEISALVSVANDENSATTDAHIDGKVVAGNFNNSASNADVVVTASADYHHLAIGGSVGISGGSAAVSPSFLGMWLALDTSAHVEGDVWATGDTFVLAEASEHLTMVSIALAVSAKVSFDAAVIINTINNSTNAYVDSGASVLALGNVLIAATDNTKASAVAGGAAVGFGTGGLGASPAILTIKKSTEAYIASGAQVDAFAHADAPLTVLDGNVSGRGFQNSDTMPSNGVAVQATSSEDIHNYALAGAGGATVGVAGGVAYTYTNSNTQAYAGDGAKINQRTQTTLPDGTTVTPAAPDASQSVNIAAANDVFVYHLAGVLAGAQFAVDGAIDVGTTHNNTSAYIGKNATVEAKQDRQFFRACP